MPPLTNKLTVLTQQKYQKKRPVIFQDTSVSALFEIIHLLVKIARMQFIAQNRNISDKDSRGYLSGKQIQLVRLAEMELSTASTLQIAFTHLNLIDDTISIYSFRTYQ
jgi:hypothetical protein